MSPIWIALCTLGEALGIGIVATVYAALDRGVLHWVEIWVLAAGAAEGVCLGAAQAVFLRKAAFSPLAWIALTVLAAATGYGLSLVGGAGTASSASAEEPSLPLLLILGAAMGLAMGALLGLPQWVGARKQIAPIPWIAANALGWAPAMAVIMLAATSVEREWPLGMVALVGAGAGAAAGLFVGAATSFALPRLHGAAPRYETTGRSGTS